MHCTAKLLVIVVFSIRLGYVYEKILKSIDNVEKTIMFYIRK